MGKVAASEQQQLIDCSLLLSSSHQYRCTYTYYRCAKCGNVGIVVQIFSMCYLCRRVCLCDCLCVYGCMQHTLLQVEQMLNDLTDHIKTGYV